MCVSCRSSATSRSTSHGAPSASRCGAGEQLERPEPRQAPERELQHARPVRAAQRRIRRRASRRAAHERVVEAPIAGQRVGAAEEQPVLMPVELPDDLVVAGGGIEIGHAPSTPAASGVRARVACQSGDGPELETAMSRAGRSGRRGRRPRARPRRRSARGKSPAGSPTASRCQRREALSGKAERARRRSDRASARCAAR